MIAEHATGWQEVVSAGSEDKAKAMLLHSRVTNARTRGTIIRASMLAEVAGVDMSRGATVAMVVVSQTSGWVLGVRINKRHLTGKLGPMCMVVEPTRLSRGQHKGREPGRIHAHLQLRVAPRSMALPLSPHTCLICSRSL
jgi:hypothetical protein